MLGAEQKSQLLEMFNKSQRKRKDSFSTSLPYYLLTGRKGCKAYTDGTATVMVALHPHVDGTVLVFPEMNGNGQLTTKVLNRLAHKNVDVQLARYTAADRYKLNLALQRDHSEIISSIKCKQEDIMDWRYPAHILNTNSVSTLFENEDLNGKEEKNGLSELKRKFNKASGKFDEIPLSHPEAMQKIRSSILIWSGLMIGIGHETGHDMTGLYDKLVEMIVDFPSMFDGFVLSHNGEPAGFTIWDETGYTANGIAGLSRRSIMGMSEYQMVRACQILDSKGISRYNIGGSETLGLERFKLKFRPVDSIRLRSYDVKYNGKNIKEISLVDGQTDALNFNI